MKADANRDLKKLTSTPVLKSAFVLLLVIMVFHEGWSQDDTLKNSYQEEFDNFKKNTQLEFETFKNHNDSVFYNFLKESWQEFDLMLDERETKPKPGTQPKMDPIPHRQGQIEPVKGRSMLDDIQQNLRYKVVPSKYETYKPAKPYTTIDFYGTKVEVYKAKVESLAEGLISNKGIAEFFKNTVNNDDLVYSVFHLQNKAVYSKLNGWGYLRLLQEASSTYYNNLNERVLFTWSALIKSGYDARVGFAENDVFLLVNFDVPVFYKQYLIKDNRKYYLIAFNGQDDKAKTIQSFQHDYPAGLARLPLLINEIPAFGQKVKSRKLTYDQKKVNVEYNHYMVDFYETYPDCGLSVYFPPPLSKTALKSLDKILDPKMNPADNSGKLNVLLDFVQHAIPYDTDNKQFGFENYFFAEETLFYPYADCEDRTVLLAQMVSHFTGFKSIGLVYPGHVTLAVHIPGFQNGNYVAHKGERYYVCDPTYIGAKCGMLMPGFEKQTPEIIEFEL